MKKCRIEDCGNMAGTGRGMCHKHYARWRKHGDPLKVKRISGPMPLRERFDMQYKIDPITGCWNWIGHIGAPGYGRIKVNRATSQAHRVSYELHVGPIGDLCVCHKCDNTKCVNPKHLFLGTNKDNSADMVRKGRHASRLGENHHKAKLTWATVATIRNSKEDSREIAKRLGVSFSTIYRVRRGDLWNANRRQG